MPFFIKNKRKRPSKPIKKITKSDKGQVNGRSDEEISSESEEEPKLQGDFQYSDDSEVEETVQEKRIRLASKYLEEIEKEEKERLETDEIDRDVIADRLRKESLEQAGKLRRLIADNFEGHDEPLILTCKEHSRTITCVFLTVDNKLMFSASDDFNIVKWSFSDRKKLGVIKRTDPKGHKKKILALSVSSDGKYLVSGDASAKINVWLVNSLEHVHCFLGHKTDVTGLTFRRDTHQLFSCSSDKTIKIWSVDEKAYVETLYGHQSGIANIDSLHRNRCVTAGGRDDTIRIWKVSEESHLVLNGNKGSIDCVRLLNEDCMISGGEDGAVCIWSSMKKKPLMSLPAAHGQDAWIISVATCPNTDLFASGSSTGLIRLYSADSTYKKFSPLFDVPVEGHINAMAFSSDGQTLVAAVGKEHRLGRWSPNKIVKNCIVLINLRKKINK